MQVWNVLHKARWNTGRNKIAKKSPSGHHRTNLLGYIFGTKARIVNRKKLLNSNISHACLHNTGNFGPLAAEIDSGVWGTPANFNWFRVLAALLHGTLVLGASQTLGVNSAGRPSCWALAHILVSNEMKCLTVVLFRFTTLPEDYVGASFVYNCPASRDGSLRQHGLLVKLGPPVRQHCQNLVLSVCKRILCTSWV